MTQRPFEAADYSQLEPEHRKALEAAVETLNEHGRQAAAYLSHLLLQEDNQEAAGWVGDDIAEAIRSAEV